VTRVVHTRKILANICKEGECKISAILRNIFYLDLELFCLQFYTDNDIVK
jgi:hypothetical protein